MSSGPQEDEGNDLWARLHRRRVVQWGLAYAAGAWGCLQGLQFVSDSFNWSPQIRQAVIVGLLIGLPAVLVLAWYHGEKGAQRVTRTELAVLTVLFLGAGGAFWHVGHRNEAQTVETRAVEPAQVAKAGAIRSLAVMPLENLSKDPEQEFFVDGMHDELITRLSKLGDVKVISRMSTMQYRNAPKPPAEVGRELGVEGLIDGSVRRSGNRVAITVQLVRAATGESLWAESYQRDITDVLALQSEIAQAIATAVGAVLTPEQKESLAAAPKVNPDAYDAYLRGRRLMWSLKPEDYWQGKAWFEKAIAIDPSFAQAYAHLAFAYLRLGYADQMQRREALTRAEEIGKKAVELQATPENLFYLALIQTNLRFMTPNAVAATDRLLAIDPNNGYAYFIRAKFDSLYGRHDQAIADQMKGMEVEPACRPYCDDTLGMVYRWARRPDDAGRIARSVLQQRPDDTHAWQLQALLDLEAGRSDDAIKAADTFARLAPSEPWTKQYRAYIYAKSGRASEARRMLAELEADWAAGRPTSPVMIGLIHLALGDREQFFPWLDRAFDAFDIELAYLQDPKFDPVRDDPRFQWAMQRRTGQVQGPYVPSK